MGVDIASENGKGRARYLERNHKIISDSVTDFLYMNNQGYEYEAGLLILFSY
ncbi:hypothetical protein VIBNISOn1_p0016 [Vibrio nigripulchritudo SOn1]|uniref:Uncharacterized protein n=1 Tax=Vibrio nigripulchritudo SOn1 TaxID=1238450 RepID=A0AAV2VZH6_9VIBR|nr:hypothetical protein VIBNISOn1_p0016 [Vibrio nigripulchritudo SOn1]